MPEGIDLCCARRALIASSRLKENHSLFPREHPAEEHPPRPHPRLIPFCAQCRPQSFSARQDSEEGVMVVGVEGPPATGSLHDNGGDKRT